MSGPPGVREVRRRPLPARGKLGDMGIEPPNDIERAAIEEHAQRTVEQTALRKVRKTLDRIGQAEIAERRALRKVLIVCAILAALGACYFCWLVFSGSYLPRQPPMKIPGTLPLKR
jgi:hypothetical protein